LREIDRLLTVAQAAELLGTSERKAQVRDTASGLGLEVRAGEGNRTPTVSLGICWITAVVAVDLAIRLSVSTPD